MMCMCRRCRAIGYGISTPRESSTTTRSSKSRSSVGEILGSMKKVPAKAPPQQKPKFPTGTSSSGQAPASVQEQAWDVVCFPVCVACVGYSMHHQLG